jgi:glucose/arabinose dehydrogenase
MLAAWALQVSAPQVCAQADAGAYRTQLVAEGLNEPWGLAFLPDGAFLVSERPGTLRHIAADGTIGPPLDGVPPVFYRGQGGLLDVRLHPGFATNRWVYLSYAHGDGAANATRVARATLGAGGLEDLEVLFTVAPTKNTPQHYGGVMRFLPDGTLLLTTGDGFDYREQAQNLAAMLGKTLRINDDGSIPEDNPFVMQEAVAAAVWTYGHRNPQGLTVDPLTRRVFQNEHGPRGGDEVNMLLPGTNYGWPAITYGMDYTGAYVSPFSEAPGMAQPLLYWVPSIAPSGLAIYRGTAFPEWDGDLFVGALVDREVRRIDLEDGQVVGQESLFSDLGERIRNVQLGPDEHLYLLTDGKRGGLLRVDRR